MYDEIESEIRRLLKATNPGVQLPAVSHEATVFARTDQPSYAWITDETCIRGGSTPSVRIWRAIREANVSTSSSGKARGRLSSRSGEVNLVMQPGPSGSAAVTVLLEGKPVGEARGADVGTDGVARFDRSGMIRLVAGAARRRHVLTLVTSDPGVRAFAFTFGP